MATHPDLSVFLVLAAGFLAFGALVTVNMVGRPREPISPALAAWTVGVTVLVIAPLLAAALVLW